MNEMKWYRVYFYAEREVFQGRQEFMADDDRTAMVLAELLCDACSDLCETFELWDGARRVDMSFSRMPRPSVSAEQVAAATQTSLVRTEEALLNSNWALARSKRLIERMEHLIAAQH
ncbi:MAG TPA: hypothetical protein VJO12_02950 [Stellaceae bacterium]|nr:hypothetical protein [Stellaceae bacterium]